MTTPPDDGPVPKAVHAAGAVLWRPASAGGVEVAVVHRPHHGDWSLPKGKVDEGESRARTAVREIAEETGFGAVLGRHVATVRYMVGEDRKVVDYWDARAGAGSFTPNGETDELRWLAPAAAAPLLTYDSDRDVLADFTDAPFPLRTLLLVRHAKAGKRGSHDDDARPLVDAGREQARRLGDLLAAHGVERLYSVGRTRCIQTLEPASHRLGVGIAVDDAFADEAVAADPHRARERLLELAGRDGVAAVCAQGYGIPALVRDLAADPDSDAGPRPGVRSNRRLSDPPSRKGSAWVLSFHGTTLVAADYVRDPAV
ncbi:NUDIX hydrolase [Actinomycetospora chiangmaiensis]|uniref:NUDIX hydrolase n=1 Tax=Actinomycetospora chiangmaiensis TaxID=402650 RepID=UPI000380C4C8|nr:NUDIX hydrolase [Actinomycetospora chiangmaiensis]